MRALSIRQPYAELILRGIKTAELRSMSTTIVGERFFIYACKAKAKQPICSDDLRVGTPPAWMIELAEQVKLIEPALLRGAMFSARGRRSYCGTSVRPECSGTVGTSKTWSYPSSRSTL